ncbi:hypothetical protein NDU88_001314 [Pleurodeles waltl]|uniref:Uncharacterized protein n=1 Tax=Pleurodeles waltl TaxID=8319 RepID=A0AAV7U9T4_PLEWA|nr:hypothetical protein NDU88_001314 [Pleurodeles waltl]
MAGYDEQADDLYYIDDTAGFFDQDLVYALDAGVRHSVNQALVQAIQPINITSWAWLINKLGQRPWAHLPWKILPLRQARNLQNSLLIRTLRISNPF